jgi:Mn2+/Fe2+ NRAMP family transporter
MIFFISIRAAALAAAALIAGAAAATPYQQPHAAQARHNAPATTQTTTPASGDRPYTMLMVGLGLLAFSSRSKRTEKFVA